MIQPEMGALIALASGLEAAKTARMVEVQQPEKGPEPHITLGMALTATSLVVVMSRASDSFGVAERCSARQARW
ncbi:hypothetical protein ACIBEJ_36275 [Nonomuraea sp. NPDC050790]|uniref:hypothetical protein n=1 Tax=Nonomuraea sp. NPDC050790 TaxID=3364371 RepID=UPI0037A5C090